MGFELDGFKEMQDLSINDQENLQNISRLLIYDDPEVDRFDDNLLVIHFNHIWHIIS